MQDKICNALKNLKRGISDEIWSRVSSRLRKSSRSNALSVAERVEAAVRVAGLENKLQFIDVDRIKAEVDARAIAKQAHINAWN